MATNDAIQTAIDAIDAIDASDPQDAHSRADKILLVVVPPEVAAAYDRLIQRSDWWDYS